MEAFLQSSRLIDVGDRFIRRGLSALLGAVFMVASFLLGGAQGVSADDEHSGLPPAGYPAHELKAVVVNPNLHGTLPIRRGFYNADSDSAANGFGYDKAYHRHGFRDLESIKWVMMSSNISVEGNAHVFRAYAQRFECTLGFCTERERVEIRAVVSFNFTDHYGPVSFPQKVTLGLLTIYCVYPGQGKNKLKCDQWVYDFVSLRARGGGPYSPYSGGSSEEYALSYSPQTGPE